MGLNGHGQNSGCRWTTLGRDADRKEQLEQSSEMIVKEKKNEMDSRETKSSNRNEKKTIKNKPQTGNAASEAPPGAERPLCFISPCQSMPIRAISSVKFPPILVRNFYVKNGEFLRNFYVEIASGYCQLIGILRPIRQTDRLSLLLITTAHKTGGTRTHFGLVLVCLIDTVKLGVGKQVSE